jgi:hypothetical protein
MAYRPRIVLTMLAFSFAFVIEGSVGLTRDVS